jgi:hypothetical protein
MIIDKRFYFLHALAFKVESHRVLRLFLIFLFNLHNNETNETRKYEYRIIKHAFRIILRSILCEYLSKILLKLQQLIRSYFFDFLFTPCKIQGVKIQSLF